MTTVERMGKWLWKSLICLGILHFYTWRSVELSKEWQLWIGWGNGDRENPQFVTVFYTSTHREEWKIESCGNPGFHGQYWTWLKFPTFLELTNSGVIMFISNNFPDCSTIMKAKDSAINIPISQQCFVKFVSNFGIIMFNLYLINTLDSN